MNESMLQNANTPALPNVGVKIYPRKDQGKLLAYASVNLGGIFTVNSIRIYNSDKGPFVSLPSNKGKDGRYHGICYPTTKEMREALNSVVLDEYRKAMERLSEGDALQNAAEEAADLPAQAEAADGDAQ